MKMLSKVQFMLILILCIACTPEETVSIKGSKLSAPSSVATPEAPAKILSFEIVNSSPTNSTTANLRYSFEGEKYSQYCLLENDTDVDNCDWINGTVPSTYTLSLAEGSKTLSVFLANSKNEILTQATSNSIVLDLTAPVVPAAPYTIPASPNVSIAPYVKGAVNADVNLMYLFSDATCSIMIGFGSGNTFSSSGLPVSVTALSTTDIYSIVEDRAGNDSACTHILSYQNLSASGGVSTNPPVLVSLLVTSSHLTSNLNATIALSASYQTADMYCLLENDVNVNNCAWTALPFPTTHAFAAGDGNKILSAFLKDPDGNISNRVDSAIVVLDQTNPSAPAGMTLSPGSPGNTLTPYIRGTVSADTRDVFVYSDPTCTGLPIGYGTGYNFSTSGIPALVNALSTTSLYLKAVDGANNSSACTLGASYTHQNAITTPLSVGYLSLSATSPSTVANPNMIGYAGSAITTVRIYSDSSCTTEIGNGTKATFESGGVPLTVPANANTNLYGRGEDASSNFSPCTYLTSYRHDNIAPGAPATLALSSATYGSTSTTPTLTWSGGTTDAGSGFKDIQYSIGTSAGAVNILGWTTTTTTSSLQVGGLTLVDGTSYYINLRSRDNAGNISTVASSSAWTVDVSSPASVPVYVTSAPLSPTNATLTPSIIGTASADTATVKIFSDPGCTAQVGTGTKAQFEGAGISVTVNANASTSLFARAYDAISNYSPTCTYLTTYINDSTAPSMDALTITNSFYTKNTSFGFAWGAVYGSPTTYCILENNTSNAGCTWTSFPLPTSFTVSGTNGPVVLSVWVRDNAGNISARTDSPSRVFDNLAPAWATPALSYATTSLSKEISPSVSYNRNATDANAVYYQYALGTGTAPATRANVVDWTTVTATPFTISGLSLTDASSYYVNMKVVDAAGNETIITPASAFTVNVPVPQPNFLSFIPASPNGTTTTPLVKGHTDGIAANIYFYSDAACSTLIGSGTTANYNAAGVTITASANGATMVYARTSDAGTTKYSSCTLLANYIHDTTGPVAATSIDDGDYFNSLTTSPSISWIGGGVDGGSGFARFEYAIGTTPGGTDIRNWTSTGTLSAVSATGLTLIEGTTYYGSVRAVDNVGIPSNVLEGDGWVVDTTISSIAVSNPEEASVVMTQKRDFVGTCEAGAIVHLTYGTSVSGSANVVCDSSGTFTANVSFSGIEGNRSITFTQEDGAGNSSSLTRIVSYQPTFNQLQDGFNNSIWAMDQFVSGTQRYYYVGGDFTQYGDITMGRFVRLKDDGTIDEQFVTGEGFNNQIRVVMSDTMPGHEGRVYVGGTFTTYDAIAMPYLIRLMPNGSIDSSFSPGTINGAVYSLAYAPDGTGDIYVGGAFTTYTGVATNRIVRITATGAKSTATTFNSTATITTASSSVLAIEPAKDGTNDIYIGGSFTTVNAGVANYMARLTEAGAHNATFYTNLSITSNGFNGAVYDIHVDESNTSKVYVGGNFSTYKGVASSSIIRLNSTGTTDAASFPIGTGFTGGTSGIVFAIKQVPGTSDIVVAGDYTLYKGVAANRIVRLNSSGVVNNTPFNPRAGFDGQICALMIPGTASNPTSDVIVGGAFNNYNTTGTTKMARLNMDGTLDNILEIGAGASAYVKAFLIAADGSEKAYVGGSFTTYQGVASNYIARVNGTGLLDSTFAIGTGFNGIVHEIIPRVSRVGLTATQKKQIYVGGAFSTYKGVSYNKIVRLNDDGTVDASFNVGTGFDTIVYRMLPTKDGTGDLYVAGNFSTYKGVPTKKIVRLDESGNIVYSFNVGAGFNADVRALLNAPDNTNDIFVGGNFTTYQGTSKNHIVRLQDNGLISSKFVTGTAFGTSTSVGVYSMDADPSHPGSIYVGGNFTVYQGFTSVAIARLKENGNLDNNFFTGAGIGFLDTAPDPDVYSAGVVYALAARKDGSVLLGGRFNRYNGSSNAISPHIIKLNNEGTIDATFAVGSGANNYVYGIFDTGDGSGDYLVGGDFTTYNGLTRNALFRVQSNGNAN